MTNHCYKTVQKALLPSALAAYRSIQQTDNPRVSDSTSLTARLSNISSLAVNSRRAACESLSMRESTSFPVGTYLVRDCKDLLDFIPKHKDASPVMLGEIPVKSPGGAVTPLFRTEDGEIKAISGLRFNGQWKSSFGGRIEPEETISETMLRESQEEFFTFTIPGHGNITKNDLEPDVFVNRVRKEKNGQTTGYDMFSTTTVIIDVLKSDLDQLCQLLNEHTPPAQAARIGLINGDQNAAAIAIKDTYLMSLIKAQAHGEEAVKALELTALGRHDEVPDSHRDPRGTVVAAAEVFSEYGKFKVTDIETLTIQHIIGSKEVFTSERQSIFELTKQARVQNLLNQLQQDAYW